MKRHLILITILLGCILNVLAQTNGQNYITTTTPTTKILYATSLNNDNSIIQIEYFDGLGRPIQTVQRGITPLKNDLLTYTDYDGVGREYRQWLPAAVSSSNGGAFVSRASFVAASNTVYGNDSAFNKTIYEPSPLNRIDKQYGSGQAWTNHPTAVQYGCNNGDVPYFFVNTMDKLQCGSNYASATLYKTTTTDEDGKTSTEYKDKLGRVVMTEQDQGVKTCYVYNDLNQLCYVLPPLATDKLTAQVEYADNDETLKQYAYLYKYDERGNCIAKRLPGCEWIYMVYDTADRLVLSQDGNQRLNNRWTKTMYDKFGRIIYIIEVESESSFNILSNCFAKLLCVSNFNSTLNNGAIQNLGYELYPQEYYQYRKVSANGSTTLPIPVVFNLIQMLTINYYDNYSFVAALPSTVQPYLNYEANSGYDKAYPTTATSKEELISTGLLTGTRTYLLDGSGNYTVSVLYYDHKGQVVQSRSTNHLGGYDMVYNTYNFSGKPTSTYKTHNISGQSTVTERYTYSYDHALRPLVTNYYLNGATTPVVLSDMSSADSYDELGRLRTKKRHGGADTETYAYNIRNWTTQIKSGNFTEKLYYNTNPLNARPCYNGNISYSTWTYNNGSTTAEKGYAYEYDELNRLVNAEYQQGSSSQATGSFNEQFTYDKMGNILTLQRKKDNALIDNLTYNYKNNNSSNQLDYITDAAGTRGLSTIKEYQGLSAATAGEFQYDANGNLIKDADREIVRIKYNLLNLPDTVVFANGNLIINRYDASGRKLLSRYLTKVEEALLPVLIPKKNLEKPSEIIGEDFKTIDEDLGVPDKIITLDIKTFEGYETNYAENFEYESTVNIYTDRTETTTQTLTRLHTPEGYITTVSSPQYHYYRRDHLGNNREVWLANTNTTLQRTQYYPSGLPWAESVGASAQNRKYNGKEFVEMHGWDTYDYGARGMYAAIGRWTSVDPLAELMPGISPYSYCAGNPVNRIDPTGLYTVYGFDGKAHEIGDKDVVDGYLDADHKNESNKQETDKNPESFVDQITKKILNYFGWGLNPDDSKDREKLDEGSKHRVEAAENIKEANKFLIINGALFFVGEGAAYCLEKIGGTLIVRIVGKEAVQAAEEGINVVYLSVEKEVTQYVGITNNFAKRAAQHADRFIITPLIKNISRYDARSVEQALIEIHHLGKDGGTLLNKINSIATSNPIYKQSLERGYQILKSIGYEF